MLIRHGRDIDLSFLNIYPCRSFYLPADHWVSCSCLLLTHYPPEDLEVTDLFLLTFFCGGGIRVIWRVSAPAHIDQTTALCGSAVASLCTHPNHVTTVCKLYSGPLSRLAAEMCLDPVSPLPVTELSEIRRQRDQSPWDVCVIRVRPGIQAGSRWLHARRKALLNATAPSVLPGANSSYLMLTPGNFC